MGLGKSLMGHLLIVNFVVYFIMLCLAGWSIDKYIDGEQSHPHLGGNEATIFLLVFTLVGGAIGGCSLFAGITHIRAWQSHSLSNATSSASIALVVTIAAFGFMCKQIILGGHRGKRLKTLEAFVVLSMLSQLMYLVLLHVAGTDHHTPPPTISMSEAEYRGLEPQQVSE